VGTRRYVLFKSKLEKEKEKGEGNMKKKDKNRKVGRLSWAIVFNRKATHGGAVEVIIAIVVAISMCIIYIIYNIICCIYP